MDMESVVGIRVISDTSNRNVDRGGVILLLQIEGVSL